VQESVHYKGQSGIATRWRETLEVGVGATVIAHFDDGTPAVARHGRVHYLAGWFDLDLQRSLLRDMAMEAGLAPVRLPDGLRIRRRGNTLFAFNYNDTPMQLNLPDATWTLGSEAVPPRGVCVAVRNDGL
jgi:beta-galactosidase